MGVREIFFFCFFLMRTEMIAVRTKTTTETCLSANKIQTPRLTNPSLWRDPAHRRKRACFRALRVAEWQLSTKRVAD